MADFTTNEHLNDFAEGWFTSMENVRVRYLHKGEGDAVLLVPGFVASEDELAEQAEELAKNHSVYLVEVTDVEGEPATEQSTKKHLSRTISEFVDRLDEQTISIASVDLAQENTTAEEVLNEIPEVPVEVTAENQEEGNSTSEYVSIKSVFGTSGPVASPVRSSVPEPERAELEDAYEAEELVEREYVEPSRNREEAADMFFDIQKVDIGPKTMLARVRVNDEAPLFTSDDPEGTQRVLSLLPDLNNHMCVGDVAPNFGEVIANTELAHLLEHVAVEIMARTQLAGDISSGRTRNLAGDDRLFEIELDCPDDVLTAGALSSAAWVLEWAYTGGEEPTPDIDGIVGGLYSLVNQLTGQTGEVDPSGPEELADQDELAEVGEEELESEQTTEMFVATEEASSEPGEDAVIDLDSEEDSSGEALADAPEPSRPVNPFFAERLYAERRDSEQNTQADE